MFECIKKYLLKKKIQQINKSKKDNIIFHRVKLSKWCESYGNMERYSWIVNNLITAMEKDVKLGDYMMLDENLDMYLDENGVLMFSDVLIDFFGEKEVLGMYKYLATQNKVLRLCADIKKHIDKTTDSELIDYWNIWKKYSNKNNTDEYIQIIIQILKSELDKRNLKY